jgi:nicotinic acetylcholine receptor
VDEKNEMLHTNMWLNYGWKDYKLHWNETEYGGVKSIRLPSKMIWTPDILMYNSADEDIDSMYPTNIVVYSDGSLSWVPLGLYISSCSINIKWFPFDDQICQMKFGSWTYDGSKINLTARLDTIDISNYQASGEWDLIDYPAKRSVLTYECCPEPYIDITFTIHIRRRTLYYGFNLIIPCALISSLTLLTFFLPPDAGEKISLGITILLSLSVFSLTVADSVPTTSLAVPLLGVYFASIMVMCTLSVIMTVLVLNFHHRNPDMYEMPLWIRKVVCEWMAWAMRMSRPGKDLSRQFLLRKAKMRELEARTPPSVSLISNVKDVDNSIPLNDFPPVRGIRMHMDDHGILNVKNELLAILNELRFITHKIKEDADAVEDINDWKFAAMVIDRLCIWVFSACMVVTTLGIFFSAPNLFG